MFVWTVEFEEHWSWSKKGEYEEGDIYTIAARSSDEAIKKAEKLARVGAVRKDYETDEEYSLVSIRLVSIQRGTKLDAVTP